MTAGATVERWLDHRYARVLDGTMRRPALVVGVAALVFILFDRGASATR